MLGEPRLREDTKLWLWVAGLFLFIGVASYAEKTDSGSYLRYDSGIFAVVIAYPFLMYAVLWTVVILFFVPIQKLRARNPKHKEWEEQRSRFRQTEIKETAEMLIEMIDKGDSHRAERQEIIDKLDELNDNYDA